MNWGLPARKQAAKRQAGHSAERNRTRPDYVTTSLASTLAQMLQVESEIERLKLVEHLRATKGPMPTGLQRYINEKGVMY